MGNALWYVLYRVTDHKIGVLPMPEVAKNLLNSDAVMKTGKPPYPFRMGWFLLLLAINFLVAAYYFHIIE